MTATARRGLEALRRRVTPARAALLELHLLAALTPLLADVDAFWRDEQIVVELTRAHTAREFLLAWPQWPPHFPTWFLLPELAGYDAAIWASRLSLLALVYPTYRIGRRTAGAAAGLQAALVVAASPYLAAQASWLRMYAPLSAALVWGLWWALAGRQRRAVAAVLLAAVLHPFGAFGGLWLLGDAARRRAWGRPLAGGVLAVLPAAAAVGSVLVRHGTIGPTGVYHGIAPDPLRVVLTPATTLAGSPHALVQVGLLLVATAAIGWGRDRRLCAWVLGPLAVVTAVSYLVTPIYRVKYFGFVAPAVAVLLAATPRRRRMLAGACLGAAMVFSWVQRLRIPAIVARRFIFWF